VSVPAQPRARVILATEGPGTLFGHWASTLIYAVLSFILFYVGAFVARETVFVLITGFFAAFGVAGIAYMVWRTLEVMKHGDSRLLLLAPMPALGGRLYGRLSLSSTALRAGQNVRAQLQCTKVTKYFHKNGGTSNVPCWGGSGRFPVDAGGVRIALDIPAELPPLDESPPPLSTGERPPEVSFKWELKVSADLPGIDFSRTFLIEVLPPQPGQVLPQPGQVLPPLPAAAKTVAPEAAPELHDEVLAEPSKAATWFLIAANLLPIYGVLKLGWNVADVVFLYWAENLVLGAMNVMRILLAQPNTLGQLAARGIEMSPAQLLTGKTVLAAFFLVHYGGFCFGHGVFLASTFGKGHDAFQMAREMLREPGMLLAVAALVLSHGFSLLRNYIGRGEYLRADVPKLMMRPYGRIVVVHLFVFAGGMAIQGFKSPALAIVAFVIIKIAVDAWMHKREREAFA
jgi:hypothetical protein